MPESSSIDPYRVLQVSSVAEHEVIQGAFRALALKYHPDRDDSAYAQRRMMELNAAYALVRDPNLRAQWDRAQRLISAVPTAPGRVGAPRPDATGTRISFGRYAGWTLRDLAVQDPDYLRWLSRHSSGLRYRTEIYQILGRQGVSAA